MSVATAMVAVGTVLAAKTAIEGIEEGNLLKAAIGGVGAYYGMSGLEAGAASASTNAAGATASNATIDAATNTALKKASEQAVTTTAGNAANAAANATANGAAGAGSIANGVNAGVNSTMQNATSSTLAGLGEQAASSPGLLGTLKEWGGAASQWANDNPMAASSIVQMGGGLLQGYAQGGKSDDEMKALEESRRRRQLSGDTSFMRKQYFNPTSGRFEVA